MEDTYVRQGVGGGTDSNLFPGLDATTMSALVASEKNWNSDFLNGSSNISGMAQNVTAAVDFAANAPAFATYIVSYITGIVGNHLAEATVDMLSIDASQIIGNATEKVAKYIKTPQEILGSLLKNDEDIFNDLKSQANLAIVNNLNKTINENVGKLTKSINKQLSYIQPVINSISKYAYMGPHWVKSNVDVATNKIITFACQEIDRVKNNVKKIAQQQIDKLSDNIASQTADELNIKLQQTYKDQMDKLKKEKTKALLKAKTAATNALFDLIGIMGF